MSPVADSERWLTGVLLMSNILIVDDEVQILMLLSEVLSEAGHTPILARNATEGLNKFFEEDPDLVLLDLRLPDGDGLDVLRRIRKSNPNAMVIIISAFGTVKTSVQAISIGAYDFIEKPLETNRVLVTIKNGLENKRLRREVETLRDRISERCCVLTKSAQNS